MTGNGNGRNGKNGRANGRVAANNRNRRRRRDRRRRDRSQSRRFALVTALAVVLGGIAVLVAAAFTGAQAFRNSCSLASLRPVSIGQNSFVYAADGSVLGAIPAEKNRQPVDLDQMSPLLAEATVAIEDRRFYSHDGIDYEGILRAAVKNLESGEIVQGGSTLTQQLVRNLYIGNEVSWERKTKEACLALKLEEEGLPNLWGGGPQGASPDELKRWRKDRILETYLNQVYFGSHAYGAEAAAQTYFSKHAGDLNLVQAALVAGMPQAPSVYDPFQRPDEALRRRNEVLAAMLDSGYIEQASYQRALRAPLGLEPGQLYTKIREPFFFSFVREQLIDKYGASTVRGGGLRVYTTIEPRAQKLAVRAIQETLNQPGDPASAIVSINPRNGAIRAMTAVVPGKKQIQFNLAAQGRRQTGSSFKTFVLVEAIRQGISPSTQYLSAPFHWQPDPNSEPWDVATYSHSYLGPVPISSATLSSDNTVYARLTLDVGPENVAAVAQDMGIETKLQPVASIGLGSNSVSVLEMASAYATLAAGGVHSEPMAIRKVVLPNGRVDKGAGWGVSKRRRVMPDGVAYEVTKILQQNMTGGTGTGAYYGDPSSAGKTGTTDSYADAWFAGYTPRASTVVWVGYPNAQIEMTSVHGIQVAGGTFPASIWRLFMSRVFAGAEPRSWPLPQNPAVWLPFDGQYAFHGAPEPPKQEEEEDDGDKRDRDEPAPTTTEEEPPPATTEPPPTTTEPPPTTTGT
ncbi:MAG TPA: transglycosylase domain-containing protein [Gaiellaceae bacterium]|nr:transglycosylase domain-containing protein [Gaiellaceae bacterium]